MEREKAGAPRLSALWAGKKWSCHGDVAVSSPQYAGNTAFDSSFPFFPVFSLAGSMPEAFSCAFRWDFKKQEPFPMAQP